MLACSLANTGEQSLEASRIQVRQSSFEGYPEDISINSVQRCDLCVDAAYWKRPAESPETLPCVTLCPVGAIRYSLDEPTPGSDGVHRFSFRGEGSKKLGYPVD
jgi:ferredoxin